MSEIKLTMEQWEELCYMQAKASGLQYDKVIIPDGVDRIPARMFADNPYIKEVIMPDSIETIEDGTFSNCKNLEKVRLSENLKYICQNAFRYCTNLTIKELPATVEEIGPSSFEECHKLGLKHLDMANIYFANRGSSSYNAFLNAGGSELLEHINTALYGLIPDGVSNPFGGTSAKDVITAIDAMLSQNIPVTRHTCAAINTELHSNNSDIKQWCRDYKVKGVFPDKLSFDAKYGKTAKVKGELEGEFLQRFPTVPKIIDNIAVLCSEYNIPADKMADKFDVKRISQNIKKHPQLYVLSTMCALNKDEFDKAMKSPYLDQIAMFCSNYFKYDDPRYLQAALWLNNHTQTNEQLVEDIVKVMPEISIDVDTKVEKVKSEISKAESYAEIRKIEREYDSFSFKDIECNIRSCEVELGDYRAYIMHPSDPRQVQLGYDTNCCQHLGGAGESAMMYGLASPNAGFWVIEDKNTNKILAQAEIWTTKDEYIDIEVGRLDLDDPAIRARLASTIECFCIDNYDAGDDILNYAEEGWFTNPDIDSRDEISINPDKIPEIMDSFFDTGWVEDFNAWLDGNGGGLLNPGRMSVPYDSPDWIGASLKMDFSDRSNPVAVPMHISNKRIGELLVFDNIEFANDKQIEQFAPIIGKWLDKCDYENVIMGNGYNEMESAEIRQSTGIEPPLTHEYIYQATDIYDEVASQEDYYGEYYPSPDDAISALVEHRGDVEEVFENAGMADDYKPYTDADGSCSLLKVDGKVEPYFARRLECTKDIEMATEQEAVPEQKSVRRNIDLDMGR